MASFVLALHDAGGTVPPMIAIAEVLTARGHDVTVLGQPCIEGRARAVGCRFRPFSIGDYATDRPIEVQLEVVGTLMTDRGPGDELLAAIDQAGADAVVVDANLAGVAAAAEVAGCRSTILFHSLYETYVDTWFGELWELLEPLINDTRTAFGLDAAASWSDVFGRHDRLYAVVPEDFDAPTRVPPPSPLIHPGFLVPTAPPAHAGFDRGDAEAPLVLVSLSTTDMGHGALLQTILDALGGQPLGALVTTGRQRVDPHLRVPSNVAVRDYLPHAAVLPQTSAVVTHAGLGTVAAALGSGVPLVCTPIARDQPLNASRVEAVGAGLTVPAATASVEDVRAAVHDVLADPRHRDGAARIARASAQAGGAATVADDLEQLVGSSEP